MQAGRSWSKVFLGLVVTAFLFASAGCTYLQKGVNYFQYRAEDGAEIWDFGFTVTKTPQIGLYWNSLDFFPFGYSNIDGSFVGWGGGQIGVTRHYNKCMGFGRSREVIGWGEFDPEDESTLYVRDAGILGMVIPPHQSNPAYTPACVHFFPHLGYIGMVWNVRYTELLDFFLGWMFIDIAGDDGYKMGAWSFPYRAEPAPEEE